MLYNGNCYGRTGIGLAVRTRDTAAPAAGERLLRSPMYDDLPLRTWRTSLARLNVSVIRRLSWSRTQARLWVGLAVTGACLFLAFRGTPIGELEQVFSHANYWWLLPALIAHLVALTAKARRWRLFLGARAGQADVFWAQAVGLFGTNVLPLRAGDAARMLL